MDNSIEKIIIPEQPNQVASEQLHVYVPVAGPQEKAGIASFDEDTFSVNDGKVKIKNLPYDIITGVKIDNDTLQIEFTYLKGETVKIPLPVHHEGFSIVKTGILTAIDFNTDSWMPVDGPDANGYRHLVFTPDQIGFDNPNYLVFAEDRLQSNTNSELEAHWYNTKGSGYVSTVGSFYKADDGTLVYSISSDSYKGRLLVLAGWLFGKDELRSLKYDETSGLLTLQYVDGVQKEFNVASEEYVRVTTQNEVQNAAKNIESNVNSSLKELSTSLQTRLDKKLDKVTTPASQERVYAIDTQGNNFLRQTTTSGTPQTIARRGDDGNFDVNCDNPTTDERCANLKWVKNLFTPIVSGQITCSNNSMIMPANKGTFLLVGYADYEYDWDGGDNRPVSVKGFFCKKFTLDGINSDGMSLSVPTVRYDEIGNERTEQYNTNLTFWYYGDKSYTIEKSDTWTDTKSYISVTVFKL